MSCVSVGGHNRESDATTCRLFEKELAQKLHKMALLIAAGTSTQSSVLGGGVVLVASDSIFLSDFSFVAYRILFLVDTCFWACVNTLT